MELKPGYKQTEVGVIPEDWRLEDLSACSNRITDGEHLTPKRSSCGFYLLSARNILNGRIDLSDVDYVVGEEYRRIRQRCNPETGDVLISCSGTIGRIATVPKDFECVMVRSAALVKPNPESLSGLYAQYFLQSSAGQKQIIASLNQGAQANLFLNHIQKLCVPLPPTLPEQQAIAEALSDADALIESLEQLLAKKRHLKQGAMQELLTGKKRLPGFRGEWKVKQLGDIASLYQPLTISAHQFKEAGYPVYGANGVIGFFDKFNHNAWQVTVTCRGSTCGTVNRTVEKCWITGNAMVVNCGHCEGVDKVFLYYLLASRDLSICITGTGQPQIVRAPLANYELTIPSDVEEQTAIATILGDLDAELAALEAKLAKARQLKQGMMHALLTGSIRLIGNARSAGPREKAPLH